MNNNFDLNSPLVCEGIVGDGCGGGRIFSIIDGILSAYDPQSGKSTTLLEDVKGALSISKKACILSIVCECEYESFEFDLSAMDIVNNKV